MIITFNGDEGAGKTTIGKKVAQEIGFNYYYTGQIFRDMAEKKGLTTVEYLKLGETDPSIDKEVDDYVIELAKKEDNFLIDSRMAWHFIPDSLKIYLKVDELAGVKRIFEQLQKDNTRNEIRSARSLETVLEKIRERKETDNKRYLQYYGVNIHEEKNYDFVLDTTNLSREEVFEKVMFFINKKLPDAKFDQKSSKHHFST
jgi:CMP/dCMP kinase